MNAAINGRILVLDGIEKAERNVLPVLNNLLENREMPLDDGRLLISSSRYDKLLEVFYTPYTFKVLISMDSVLLYVMLSKDL